MLLFHVLANAAYHASPQSNSEYSTFEKLHLNILSFGKAINTQSLHFLTSSQHKCKHGIKFTER